MSCSSDLFFKIECLCKVSFYKLVMKCDGRTSLPSHRNHPKSPNFILLQITAERLTWRQIEWNGNQEFWGEDWHQLNRQCELVMRNARDDRRIY